MPERHGDRGAQARVTGGAGTRLFGVGADVGHPRGAAEGEHAAGQATAGVRRRRLEPWANAVTAAPASGATHEAAQRSVGPSPSGSQIAPQAKPSVSPRAPRTPLSRLSGPWAAASWS